MEQDPNNVIVVCGRIENTRPLFNHTMNMVHHSTIRPCLLQRLCVPPHRNTMIDVRVLGCGPIRTGNGAAAPFKGVHILGEIRPAGGFDTLAESLGGPNWTVYPGPKINHITINQRGPLCVGKSSVGQNGGPVCGDRIRGNIQRLGGVEGMANW